MELFGSRSQTDVSFLQEGSGHGSSLSPGVPDSGTLLRRVWQVPLPDARPSNVRCAHEDDAGVNLYDQSATRVTCALRETLRGRVCARHSIEVKIRVSVTVYT